MAFMTGARIQALKHVRFIFPRKGCRIWKGTSDRFGFKTFAVFCDCGKAFGEGKIFCMACGTLTDTNRCDCTRMGLRQRPNGPYTAAVPNEDGK